MAKDDRLVELMAEMIIKQDLMIDEVRNVKGEIVKLNLQSGENTRAILKLADQVEKIADFESRISKLEKQVFK